MQWWRQGKISSPYKVFPRTFQPKSQEGRALIFQAWVQVGERQKRSEWAFYCRIWLFPVFHEWSRPSEANRFCCPLFNSGVESFWEWGKRDRLAILRGSFILFLWCWKLQKRINLSGQNSCFSESVHPLVMGMDTRWPKTSIRAKRVFLHTGSLNMLTFGPLSTRHCSFLSSCSFVQLKSGK